jgi:hypothetical protein
MKKTGKTMTLRGSSPININGSSVFSGELQKNIFSYSSPDQTRGWILRDAWAWLAMIDGTGGGDTRVGLTQCLTTDVLLPNAAGNITGLKAYLSQYSSADNRTIAWNQQYIHRRDSVNKDFVIPTNAFIDTTKFLHDESRVITRDLFLNTYITTESATVTTRIDWYIVLEEVELNPTESVMQQIKGIAQSISS